MASAEQPDRPLESLGSSPEIRSERFQRIMRARSLLTRLNGYERYAKHKGEVDPEEWHNHSAAKRQALEAMKKLSPVDQEIIEATFPLDGAPIPDLEDEHVRDALAETFHVQRPGEFHREVDESLERFANVHYAGT